MAEFLGNVAVPVVGPSGTFPLVTDYPHALRIERQVAIHQFISGNTKIEHRFKLGNGARQWRGQWPQLWGDDFQNLHDFWEARRGPYQPFTYNAPSDDGLSTTAYIVRFRDEPLSFQRFVNSIQQVGLIFVEQPDPSDAPILEVNAEVDRFPSGALETALTEQQQELIPLIVIQPREAGYPALYISDRRCYVGGVSGVTNGQLYLPRLLTWSGISQRLGGQSDAASFTLGNADRVFRDIAAQVDLFRADIKFALYHVGTGIKINLWAGQVVNYKSSSASEFQLSAVDGLYDVTLQYPPDKIVPVCWKPYNDGQACPFATASTGLDLVHFPSADPSFCDRGYLTANGCKAHGMKFFFGGVIAEPQSVNIKDNSTGHFGFRSETVTATSLVSDSMLNQPLVEIYTDRPFPVNCMMVSARDEGDFVEGLGIVGAGPLTSFGDGTYDNAGNQRFNSLDGQPNYGFPGTLGERLVLGTDPTGSQDYLSLDQSGDQTQGDPDKVHSGNSTFLDHFSAGVAFIIIRITDAKGIQLETLDQRSMVAIVGQGRQGWVWTEPGVRTQVVLTNPVWIAVNVYLRGIGKRFATVDEAEAEFDVQAAIDAAFICDISVEKVIGEGDETQFQFIGMLQDIKVLKDWIQEILNCCLGYFLFSNGKLKIGIREDAAAAHSFSGGNMVLNSLKLGPVQPSFNRLAVNFANPDYEMVADTMPVNDDDHIAYVGKPLDSTLNLSGCTGKSMAGRIGATRLKEELGGVGIDEWKKARAATWQTTALALGVEPGIGVSIDDEEVPGSTGLFRIEAWTLNPDLSIDLEGSTETDSMYDLVAGPKASDVPPNGVPVEFFPEPLQSKWCPDFISVPDGDAYFDVNDRTFGLSIEFEQLQDKSWRALAVLTGALPVRDFIPDAQPPIVRTVSQGESGGSLKGLTNYWARVYARDADGNFTPGSNIRHFTFEDVTSDFNFIKLGDIDWPAGTYLSAVLVVGDDQKTMCEQEQDLDSTGGLPSEITFLGPLKPATYNAPSPAHLKVRGKVKALVHGGVLGDEIVGVDSGTGEVDLGLAGLPDDWTGRHLTVIADESDQIEEPKFFTIVTYDPYTGMAMLSPDPITNGLAPHHVYVILLEPIIYTGDTIGDPKQINGIYPDGATNDESGHIIRGITAGRPHQLRRIVSNTPTVYTVDKPFDWKPDFFIVEEDGWPYSSDSTPVDTKQVQNYARVGVVIDNLIRKQIVAGGFLVDRKLNETPEELAVIRMGYVFGGEVTGPPAQYEKATFNLANILPAEVEDDVTIHYQVKRAGPLSIDGQPRGFCSGEAKLPPLGSQMQININLKKADNSFDGSIFRDVPPPAYLQIPDGSTSITYDDDFEPGLRLDIDDILSVDIKAVGATYPGRNVGVVLSWFPDPITPEV